MKMPSLVVFLFILTNYSECIRQAWLPSMMETFNNQSSILARYMREKGVFLEQFYTNKVRSTYFGYYATRTPTPKQKTSPLIPTPTTKTTTTFFETDPLEENEPKVHTVFHIPKSDRFKDRKYLKTYIPKIKEYTRNRCKNQDQSELLTTPQLIAANGYPAEAYTIITEDGYILTVHRIPYSRSTPSKIPSTKTVLLHHGLLGSSADWVISGPEKGLAYILSDAGYDVWLANARGNTYSRAHVSRNIHSAEFWNFTFHEVSQHDLPAVIDHIINVKGLDVKINYIGHSMGTTVLFALLSTKPHYNKILRAGYALAPVAYMSQIRSPIRLLAKFSNNIEYLMQILGINEFLPQSAVLRWLSKHACEINHYEEVFCENSLFVLCGYDNGQFNKTLLPLILGHLPAGASTKTLIHYAQEIRNEGRFQRFDYGPEGNIREYGNFTPPEYPIHKITLPIALFSGENDWLSSDVDSTNLYVQLVNPIQHYHVPLKAFNHIDFLWAIDAPKLVYAKLLQLLEDGVSRPKGYFDFGQATDESTAFLLSDEYLRSISLQYSSQATINY